MEFRSRVLAVFARARRHSVFLGFALILTGFVFYPIGKVLQHGRVFGGDVTEYLFTAHEYLVGAHGTFSYPYPFVPVVYLPIVLLRPSFVASYQAADVSVGFFLLFLGFAAYRLFRQWANGPLASAVGSAAILTQPLIMAEAGWTGLAQFAAMAFGMLALAELLGPRFEAGLRSAFTAGAFLALAVLSESYAASYFLLGVGLYALFRWKSRLLTRALVGRWVVMLSLPIAAGAAVEISSPQVAQSGLRELVFEHVTQGALWSSMVRMFVAGDYYLWGALFLAVLAFVVLAWLSRDRLELDLNLFPALLLAWVPFVLLLTPLDASNRAIYFLALPVAAVCAGLVALPAVSVSDGPPELTGPPEDASPPPAGRPGNGGGLPAYRDSHGRPSPSVAPIQATAVALSLAMLLVGVQGGIATQLYPGNLHYYSESPSRWNELTWLRGESGGVLYVGPSQAAFPELFPVEYAMERPIFPVVQPKILNTASQQEAAVLGWTLTSGIHWLGGGPIIVTDSEPAWVLPSPAILVYEYPYLVQLLRFGDAEIFVNFSPQSNPALDYNVSMAYAESRSSATTSSSITDTYNYPSFTMQKEIGFDANGDVNVSFHFEFNRSIVHSLELQVASPMAKVNSSAIDNGPDSAAVRLQQSYWFNSGTLIVNHYSTSIEVLAGANLTQQSTFAPTNRYGLPSVVSLFTPRNSSIQNYTLTYHFSVAGIPSEAPRVVNESTALTQNGIEWAAVARSSDPNILGRFADDPTFTAYMQTASYQFYRVV